MPDVIPNGSDEGISFQELLAGIQKIFEHDKINVDEVSDLLTSYKTNPKDWKRYAKFDTRRYTRNLVDEGNDKYNLMILCWGEGMGSSVHDHADAHCFVKMLEGGLKETQFYWPKEDDCEEPLEEKAVNYLKKNQVTYINGQCYSTVRIVRKPVLVYTCTLGQRCGYGSMIRPCGNITVAKPNWPKELDIERLEIPEKYREITKKLGITGKLPQLETQIIPATPEPRKEVQPPIPDDLIDLIVNKRPRTVRQTKTPKQCGKIVEELLAGQKLPSSDRKAPYVDRKAPYVHTIESLPAPGKLISGRCYRLVPSTPRSLRVTVIRDRP